MTVHVEIYFIRLNSQENEGEHSSHNNHSYQHDGEDSRDGDNGEGDHQSKLQERVHVEGKHSVHLLLVFGEAVENAASWRRVEETHGTGHNLREENKKKNLHYQRLFGSYCMLLCLTVTQHIRFLK